MFHDDPALTIDLECAETASSLLHSGNDPCDRIVLQWDDFDLSGYIHPPVFHLSALYDDPICEQGIKCSPPDEFAAGSPSQKWLDYIEGVSPNSDHFHPPTAQTVPCSFDIAHVNYADTTGIHEVPYSGIHEVPYSPTSSSSTSTSAHSMTDRGLCTVPDVDYFSSDQIYEADQSCSSSVVDAETSDSEESDYSADYGIIGSSQASTDSASESEPARPVNSCFVTSDHVVPQIEE